jgi:hypothetical protein
VRTGAVSASRSSCMSRRIFAVGNDANPPLDDALPRPLPARRNAFMMHRPSEERSMRDHPRHRRHTGTRALRRGCQMSPAVRKEQRRMVGCLLDASETAVIGDMRRGGKPAWPWLEALIARKPPRLVAVALASKPARIGTGGKRRSGSPAENAVVVTGTRCSRSPS